MTRHSQTPSVFGPDWLGAQLAALVPGFPNIELCVALSGGVDSTALLAALASIHPRSFKLRALHVDHSLRPASKQWAAQCRALARRLRVPLKVLTTKVERSRGESLEAAAREARYQLLATALAPNEVLLTAHHCDDQIETVLLQLFRGSGLPGIAAMPAFTPFAKGWLARPLLSRSRAELEAWAKGQGLTWVDDDSNADERLDRNYLRLRVLPLIRERWPGSAAAVSRSARHAAEAQALLDALARTDVDRSSYGESLSVKTLRALPLPRRRNALRYWITRSGYLAPDTRRLEEIAGPLINARADANPFVEWGVQRTARGDAESPAGANAIDAFRPPVGANAPVNRRDPMSTSAAAAHTRTNARPRVRSGPNERSRAAVRVQRDGDLLSLHAASKPLDLALTPPSESTATAARHPRTSDASKAPAELSWHWRDRASCDLPRALGKLELQPDDHGPIDLDALPDALTIRWRSGGERLSPRRGGSRRALKSLLQEAHIPVAERARLPLLFSVTQKGAHLIAVADLLLDETVQATPATRRRLRLFWRR